MKEYYTTAQAAELLGVHANTVCTWIRQGKLVAERPGHYYLIPAEAIQVFQDIRKEAAKGE